MMDMLESRRCCSSLGLGTQRVCEHRGQLSFLADSAGLLLWADDWHQKECSAAPREHLVLHLLPWHETTPDLPQYPLFPKPFYCRHTELFGSRQHLGARCTCNCVIPCAGIRIRVRASPCPQSAFSFLREMFLLLSPCHSSESCEKSLCFCSWCSWVSLCKSGSSACVLQGCWAAGDPALMRIL